MNFIAAKGEFITEFLGLYTSNSGANQIAAATPHCQNRFFQLEPNVVIDANSKGNAAGYINHSCDPNLEAQVIVDEGGRKHVCFFAGRDISGDEELCFDYQLKVKHDEEQVLECHCGALNCRRRLK